MGDLTDKITAKRADYQKGLEELEGARRALLADLEEVNKRILWNQGAIMALDDLLQPESPDGGPPTTPPDGGGPEQ